MGMVEGEIKHEYRWVYRCKGCKRYFNEYHEVCPYCGSGLKLVRKKI
jgi:rRNA maturation endonuclease Nob1